MRTYNCNSFGKKEAKDMRKKSKEFRNLRKCSRTLRVVADTRQDNQSEGWDLKVN